MNLDDFRGRPGRCPLCAHHIRLQGHRFGCPRGRCQRCQKFGRWLGSRLCLWCHHADETRVAAVADRIAQMDLEYRHGDTPGHRRMAQQRRAR